MRDSEGMARCCADGWRGDHQPAGRLPGQGYIKIDQLEIEHVRREVAKIKAE